MNDLAGRVLQTLDSNTWAGTWSLRASDVRRLCGRVRTLEAQLAKAQRLNVERRTQIHDLKRRLSEALNENARLRKAGRGGGGQ